MCSPMPGMLTALDKLMNESMNTMTDWIKEEWKDIEEWPEEAGRMSAQADQKQGEHRIPGQKGLSSDLPRDPWGRARTHCEKMQPGCV